MKIPRILVVPIWIAILTAFSLLVSQIARWCGAYNPQGWFFFTLTGILLAAILYVWGRQTYWWFAGKGDFEGRGFPKLWKKIFKK